MTKIIKRQLEVNDALSLWRQICQGDASITFREFYGIPGIGKTELAKQIKEALESEGVVCAHLDFDPVQNPWGSERQNLNDVSLYYDKPENLFKDLLTKWDYFKNPDLQLKLSANSEPSTFEPRAFAAQVIEQVNALPLNKIVTLICDETDHIQWDQLQWFEYSLIAPLIRSDHCLIFWLGRREKQWPKELVSVKAKVKSSLLSPFSHDDIAEQLELEKITLDKEQKDNLLKLLYGVTHGHPMATEVSEKHLAQITSENGDFQESIKILKDITEQVIKGYILRGNPLTFDEAVMLSLLRINDVSLLRTLFGNPSGALFSYGKLSNDLRANPLADLGAGLLVKSVSSWLNLYFRITDPDNYLRKQKVLVQECVRLCSKVSREIWATFAKESLYHAACASMVTNERHELFEILEDHLQSLRGSEMTFDSDSLLGGLVESLRSDKDMEDFIGRESVDQLIDRLEDEISQF